MIYFAEQVTYWRYNIFVVQFNCSRKDTGGIRKIRIPLEGTGKRSGGRVIYVDVEIKECIYFLDVYVKNEKLDLSEKEKKLLKKLVQVLKEE